MKILTVEAAFELPEDFTGGLPEALEVMATYLRNKKEPLIDNGTLSFNSVIWDKFWNRPKGYKIEIASGMHEYSLTDGKWVEKR